MEKVVVEAFKNQYVKLFKDDGGIFNGTITEILEHDVIFQTELSRIAIPISSISEITSYEEIKKEKKFKKEFKF